ncbi:PAS domain S-box protein [Methylocystis sp. 9N]|uniref:histidine kinase n=1 Tax=Methylocystis borbori TaxID=3118750 RepID=A0ABU7XH31_9HYPH
MSNIAQSSDIAPPASAAQGAASMLRAFFQAIPGPAAFLDLDLRYRFVNDEFLDAVALPESAVLGRPVEEVLDAETAKAYRLALPKILKGEPVRSERWLGRKAGLRAFIEESLRPFSPNGATLGVIAIERNLTEIEKRRLDQADLLVRHQRREAIHAAVVDSALDCIVVTDAEGRVVEFNPAATATFGFSREEAVGKTIAELIVPPELREAHNAGLKRFASGGPSAVLGRRVELEALCADGSRIPVELAITAVGASHEALFTAHLRDLRPARKAAAEIERQREALYQSEKLAALGSLLAGVAHELNNPLSIVIGQALMLREAAQARGGSDPQFASFAERGAKIETAANRCAKIVKTFLTMARQREAERVEVNIPELIERVLDLLSYSLRTAGVDVATKIEPGLPLIRADSDQLHQVLLNLVVNAQQALESQPAPRRISIDVSADRASEKIIFAFSDNGPGIPERIRNRVFEPFFTTKPQGVGTGIGLAVSRGLIESHGGSLTLAPPQPGVGATFVIQLPINAGEGASGLRADESESVAQAAPPRRHALVIDDEIEIAFLLVEILNRIGFDCECVANGAEAKARLRERAKPVDLILCDIRMPDCDGPAFYDWLSLEAPSLTSRIAFVTGDVLGPSAARFIARSGSPVIEKPFLPDDIRQVVELLTESSLV